MDTEKTNDNNLYLVHHFEGKQLVQQFIPDTLLGIEYLWGAQVQLDELVHAGVVRRGDGRVSGGPAFVQADP